MHLWGDIRARSFQHWVVEKSRNAISFHLEGMLRSTCLPPSPSSAYFLVLISVQVFSNTLVRARYFQLASIATTTLLVVYITPYANLAEGRKFMKNKRIHPTVDVPLCPDPS